MPEKQSMSNGRAFWSLERTVFLTTPPFSFLLFLLFFHFLSLCILFHLCLHSIWIKGGEVTFELVYFGSPWISYVSNLAFFSPILDAELHYLISVSFCPQGPTQDACFMIRATTCMITRLDAFFSHACNSPDSGGLASWTIWDLGVRSLICPAGE